MALGYLNAAGFSQILGTLTPSDADYLNLVRVLSGLGEASDSNGTLVGNLIPGMFTYLEAKGIGASHVNITGANDGYHKSITDIQNSNVEQNILFGILGWYYESSGVYIRSGGHFITITNQAVGSPGSLTIHNPFPNALLDVPNTAPNVQQTVPMANFAASGNNTVYYYDNNGDPVPLPSGTYLEFAANQQNVGPALGTQAILEQVFRIRINEDQLASPSFIPEDWNISGSKVLSTGGGNLDVTTKVTGTGGFIKNDSGDLIFHKDVTLTGSHTVNSGGLVSKAQTGGAFGNGSITLNRDSELKIQPDDTAPTDVVLDLAGGSGSQLTFSAANTISLKKGANTSLKVTLGGNDGNGIANIIKTGAAPTLVLEADDVGGAEKLLVSGNGTNLPTLTNGTVGGNIVGSSGSSKSGHFLTYDETDGFVHAAMTTGDINLSTSTSLYRATSSQTLTGNVSAYAVQIEGSGIDGGFSLAIGDGTGKAGVIFNGGTIATDELAFGAAQAVVYTSLENGTIAAGLSGSGGLVKFGDGSLNLTASATSFSGTTHVNSGTLQVSAASALGNSSVSVLSNASLQVNTGASISGNVTATALATVVMNGGTLGNVKLESTTNATGPVQGASLLGDGTLEDLDLNGYLGANPTTGAGTLTITGIVNAGSAAALIWSLDTLLDNTNGTAGTDWNSITLTDPDATFGLWPLGSDDGTSIALLFDFGDGLDPNSGNSFWDTNHQWSLLTFSGRSSAFQRANLSFPSSAFPAGNFTFGHVDNQTLLYFMAIPEPSAALLVSLAVLGLLSKRPARRHKIGS